MIWTRTLGSLNRFTEYVTMTFLVVVTLLTLMQILSRSVVGYSFSWTEELTRFLFIWIVFLGGSIAFRYGSHISIEIFFDKLSQRVKIVVQFLIAIICIIFFLALIIKGFEVSSNLMSRTSPSLGVPMGYVYFVIPLSGVLQILNLIDISIKYAKTGKFPREEGL